jgi:YfiH family protein
MRLREPFYAVDEHVGVKLPGSRALFTTRRGGCSSGAYASLNLGRWTADDPQAVARNRTALEERLGIPISFVRQVHGVKVLQVGGGAAEESDAAELPQADGQATVLRGRALGALVADCLPIALAGDGAVAMLHAGWRGLAGGVVASGVRALRALGADGPLTAAIGPGAGPCCYEVGEEIHEAFAAQPGSVHRGRNLDLGAIARHELEREGVTEVHEARLCTICSTEFYSHRRDRGVTGRQAGIAWLT